MSGIRKELEARLAELENDLSEKKNNQNQLQAEKTKNEKMIEIIK